jgi:hypothetical protein
MEGWRVWEDMADGGEGLREDRMIREDGEKVFRRIFQDLCIPARGYLHSYVPCPQPLSWLLEFFRMGDGDCDDKTRTGIRFLLRNDIPEEER